MKLKIENIKKEFFDTLERAISAQDVEQIRVQLLGKKGVITELLGEMKNLSPEDKREFGPLINQLKSEAETRIQTAQDKIATKNLALTTAKKENFDITAYRPGTVTGHLHPYTQIIEEIEDIFISMGFEIFDGPELESDHYNFEALNIPQNHPARDMYDTFWSNKPGTLLRTHTSSVQARILEAKSKSLPIAGIVPGRCYRHEATDASHDFMFMQCEGILVDENITIANLFATAKSFLKALFKKDNIEIRIRPGYFPFVEPGVEIDMQCPFCKSGCSVCKKSRWIEIFPGGMVHPNVLSCAGIDETKYSGFAFGFGLTRLAMIKYKISDIRLLHSGNIKFLEQF